MPRVLLFSGDRMNLSATTHETGPIYQPAFAPTTRYVDHGDEGATIVRHQIVGPTIDAIKELHNSGQHGSKDRKHVASVPAVVIEHYCNTQGITLREFMVNPEHVRRFLNDPANRDFRVWPGRI